MIRVKMTKNTVLDEVLAQTCIRKAVELLEEAESFKLKDDPGMVHSLDCVADTYVRIAEMAARRGVLDLTDEAVEAIQRAHRKSPELSDRVADL